MIRIYTTPPAPPAGDLGTIEFDNDSQHPRRLTTYGMLPLNPGEFRPGEHQIIASNTGTGQDEVCQVENVGAPYPDGTYPMARVTHPLEISARTRDHRVTYATGVGTAPTFTLRPNVVQGLAVMQALAKAGPVAQMPFDWSQSRTLYSGTHSRVLKYFARDVATQWCADLRVELLHDADYAPFWLRIGFNSPDVRFERQTWDDWTSAPVAQRTIEFLLQAPQNVVQIAPFCRDRSVYALNRDGAGNWRWVIDAARSSGTIAGHNEYTGWGQSVKVDGVLLFPGGAAGLGDAAREGALEAFRAGYDVARMSQDWQRKPMACGPHRHFVRPLKQHEHPRRVTYEQARNEIRTEFTAMRSMAPRNGPEFPWATGSWPTELLTKGDMGGSADHPSFGENALWLNTAYQVPAGQWWTEKRLYPLACWPHWYPELNGDDFRYDNHPNTFMFGGGPFFNYADDRLGKRPGDSGVQFNPFRSTKGLTAQGFNRFQGPDAGHYEIIGPYKAWAIYGNRGMGWLCENMREVQLAMMPPRNPRRFGALSQPRVYMRMQLMHAWALWAVYDESHRDMVGELAPFLDRGIANQGYHRPETVIRGIFDIWDPSGNGGQAGNLRNYVHWPPWQYGLGIAAHYALARILRDTGGNMTYADRFEEYGGQMLDAVLFYGMPRIIEAEWPHRVQWTRMHPNYGYRATTAQAWKGDVQVWRNGQWVTIPAGTRKLTRAEFEDDDHVNERRGHAIHSRYYWPTVLNGISILMATDHEVGRERLWRMLNLSRMTLPTVGGSRWRDWEASGGGIRLFGGARYDPTFLGSRAVRAAAAANLATARGIACSVTTPGEAWALVTSDGTLRRYSIATGTETLNVPIPWTKVRVRGVEVYEPGGGANPILIVGDYGDDELQRSSVSMWEVDETDPGAGATWTERVITWPGGTPPGQIRGACLDPVLDLWLLCVNEGGGYHALWTCPRSGGTATRPDPQPVYFDPRGAVMAMACSRDGKLLALAGQNGVDLFRRVTMTTSRWAVPTAQTTESSVRAATFSRHDRLDDDLRLVTLTTANWIDLEA